jgi:esterase
MASADIGRDQRRCFTAPDGALLVYRRAAPPRGAGGRTPLVLLHGAASNWTRWWYFVDHSALAAERVLLRPDLRGHGESMWRGPARLEHWVEDLAALLHHEAKPRAVVIGHCLGANIAVHFAARYPERCAGLVLVEPMLRKALTGRLAWARRAERVLNAGARLVGCLNRLGLHRGRLVLPNLRTLDAPVLEARRQAGGGAGSEAAIEHALAAHGSFWQDVRVVPTAQLMANFVELARPLPVTGVRCPSLVVQSSGGHMTDPARTRAELGGLPDLELRELRSQHWLPASYPDRLCDLIDDWVQNRYL